MQLLLCAFPQGTLQVLDDEVWHRHSMILRILGDSVADFPVQAMYQEMTDWEARVLGVKLGASVSFLRHEMLFPAWTEIAALMAQHSPRTVSPAQTQTLKRLKTRKWLM